MNYIRDLANDLALVLNLRQLPDTGPDSGPDPAEVVRERARAADEHVAREQPLQHLFRHNWTDLESRSKSGKKAES